MDTRCCPFCMTYLGEDETCPACGRRPSEYETMPFCLQPGTLLWDRYLVGGVLGGGPFHITYLGRDMTEDRKAVLQEFFPRRMADRGEQGQVTCHGRERGKYGSGRDKFLAEARRLAALEKRPALAAVTDVFQANDTAYLAVEFVEGVSLKDHVARQGPMAFEELAEKLLPVAEDLATVHDAGILHLEITPDHIMLTPEGRCVLTDLTGCVCFEAVDDDWLYEADDHPLAWLAPFAPPERYSIQAKKDAGTDVYALCAVIYYCITGQVPPASFDRLDAADDPLEPPSALGAEIAPAEERALLRGMALRPQDRPKDMRRLAADLRDAMAGQPSRRQVLDRIRGHIR